MKVAQIASLALILASAEDGVGRATSRDVFLDVLEQQVHRSRPVAIHMDAV